MRKVLVGIAVVGLLAGSACGGGAKKATPTTANGQPAAVTIKSEGTTWNPAEVTVKAGDIVEWSIDGSIVHDLKGDEAVSHKAGSKFTVSHTYAKAGTYSYQCSIHAGMTGTVTVNP